MGFVAALGTLQCSLTYRNLTPLRLSHYPLMAGQISFMYRRSMSRSAGKGPLADESERIGTTPPELPPKRSFSVKE